MNTNISMKNYKDERRNFNGITSIKNGIITVDIPEVGLIFTGPDVDRDTNTTVTLKSDSHIMELDWKNTFKLAGRWKSDGGPWLTTTLTIKDLKKESQTTWWDKNEFPDKVETALVTLYEGKLIYPKDCKITSWERILRNQFSKLKKMGIYFSPYFENVEKSGEKLKKLLKSPTFNSDGQIISHEGNTNLKLDHNFRYISLARFSEQDDEGAISVAKKIKNVFSFSRYGKNTFGTGHIILSFLMKAKTSKKIRNGMVASGEKYMSYNLHKHNWYLLFEMICREDGLVYGYKRYVGIEQPGIIYPILPGELYEITSGAANSKTAINDITSGRVQMGLDAYNQVAHHTALIVEDYLMRDPLWIVEVFDEDIRASFGVNYDQIKSLFYFADRGLTKSGRRQALLGWIRAHQRRIQKGTDVTTIKKHLRGQNEFALFGTKFKITKPIKSN